MGVMTQCMLAKHLFTPKVTYCANLALKINVKLGGTNSHCDPSSELPVLGAKVPTMIFGADVVCHESIKSCLDSFSWRRWS
jgi:hypothetical protein